MATMAGFRDFNYKTDMRRRTLILAMAGFPAAARAHSYKLGTIAIGHAWALPAQGGDGQMFFPMVNNGQTADALVAARSPICSAIELRRNNRYDDPPLAQIELKPGLPVAMRPTARHLRLVGLREPLIDGARFMVIVDFLNAGEMEIETYIEATPGD